MSTEIVTALIVAGGSIICQLLINASNRKRQESENEKTNLSECQPLRTKK